MTWKSQILFVSASLGGFGGFALLNYLIPWDSRIEIGTKVQNDHRLIFTNACRIALRDQLEELGYQTINTAPKYSNSISLIASRGFWTKLFPVQINAWPTSTGLHFQVHSGSNKTLIRLVDTIGLQAGNHRK